ncbi:MAG: prepilin-type N-terminal cleavage/methylation domain-containing protein [Thermoleophilia bacterium]|nr:prepilin-type N-terminal cleavage/methylation domain-containing protein [Thermoleophilia bacterium]
MKVDVKSEGGHTLIELLTAMSLMLVVMGALMSALIAFNHFTRTSDARAQSRDDIRAIMESMAREVRSANALAPEPGIETSAVSRGDAFDYIFKYRDPASPTGNPANVYNLERVRYCLNTTTNTLYRQTQQWNAVLPGLLPDGCPGANQAPGSIFGASYDATKYQTTRVIATDVTNGAGRPAFLYNSSTLANITNVRLQFYLDDDPTKSPAETELSTGFYLRNVNRRPDAEFIPTPMGNGHVLLNGSTSTDPEGDTIEYSWTDDGVALSETAPVVDYLITNIPSGGEWHTFSLTVTDSGHLTSTTSPQLVYVQ